MNTGYREFDDVSSIAAHVRGTEIVAQKTFILTQEEIEIKFEGYGLQLHVPANSLPTNISETQLNVQVSLSGPFQIPSNSELLSAVYWIFSPTKFAKPITVRIQHCAALTSDKQCSKLPGGVFKPHDSYGSLSLCHFSGLAIAVKEQRQQSTEPSEVTCQTRQEEEEEEIVEQYCARLYSTQKSSNVWKVDFVVTKDLEACTTVVQREYSSDPQLSFTFGFTNRSICLDIPKEGTKVGNWKITPFYNPYITRHQVNNFSSGKCTPKVELLLEGGQDIPPAPLHYSVGLLGAGDRNCFLLHINPASYTRPSMSSPSYMRSRMSSPPLWLLFLLLAVVSGIAGLWWFGPFPCEPTPSLMCHSLFPTDSSTTCPTTDNNCHRIACKQDLYMMLADIGNWQSLCTNLEVPEAVLSSLVHENLENNARKEKCLAVYFDRGEACWEKVIEVVAGYPFYNKRLATRIAQKYGVTWQD